MKKLAVSLFLSIVQIGFSGDLQSELEEYSLKAAFIYNFTKFIEWNSFAPEKEFIIGVMDNSPINEPLALIAKTKTVNNKKIIIQKFDTPDQISFSHILFVPRNFSFPLNEILSKAAVKGTLIVCEKNGFAAEGASINFIIVNNNLKFEANTKSINSAGLKASSQMLKLAVNIEGN